METPCKESGKMYLKWSDYELSVMENVEKYYNCESLADVTLSCEGRTVKAHKLILSACSEYFHRVLQLYQDFDHPILYLDNVRFKDLNYLLGYMYQGEIQLSQKDYFGVLALGRSLEVKGLDSATIYNTNYGYKFQKLLASLKDKGKDVGQCEIDDTDGLLNRAQAPPAKPKPVVEETRKSKRRLSDNSATEERQRKKSSSSRVSSESFDKNSTASKKTSKPGSSLSESAILTRRRSSVQLVIPSKDSSSPLKTVSKPLEESASLTCPLRMSDESTMLDTLQSSSNPTSSSNESTRPSSPSNEGTALSSSRSCSPVDENLKLSESTSLDGNSIESSTPSTTLISPSKTTSSFVNESTSLEENFVSLVESATITKSSKSSSPVNEGTTLSSLANESTSLNENSRPKSSLIESATLTRSSKSNESTTLSSPMDESCQMNSRTTSNESTSSKSIENNSSEGTSKPTVKKRSWPRPKKNTYKPRILLKRKIPLNSAKPSKPPKALITEISDLLCPTKRSTRLNSVPKESVKIFTSTTKSNRDLNEAGEGLKKSSLLGASARMLESGTKSISHSRSSSRLDESTTLETSSLSDKTNPSTPIDPMKTSSRSTIETNAPISPIERNSRLDQSTTIVSNESTTPIRLLETSSLDESTTIEKSPLANDSTTAIRSAETSSRPNDATNEISPEKGNSRANSLNELALETISSSIKIEDSPVQTSPSPRPPNENFTFKSSPESNSPFNECLTIKINPMPSSPIKIEDSPTTSPGPTFSEPIDCSELNNALQKALDKTTSASEESSSANGESSALIDASPNSSVIESQLPPAPNAFMLFTKDFRPKLTIEHPGETNMQISVRLGIMWKNMIDETKAKYYQMADQQLEEYKLIYSKSLTTLTSNPLESTTSPAESSKRTSPFLDDHTYVKKLCLDPLDVSVKEEDDIWELSD